MRYWLLKTEPNSYSLSDLKQDQRTSWDGVRNYQARNYLRDDMQPGDLVIFYHSQAEPPAAVGLAKIASSAYPDLTALDPSDHHFDPKATIKQPIWTAVDVEYVADFPKVISLAAIKSDPVLCHMVVAKPGSRLSVQPVEPAHFHRLCQIGGIDPSILT